MSPRCSASGITSSGGTQPVLGMLPTQERLGADHLSGAEVGDRLVVDGQLADTQGDPQVCGKAQAPGALVGERRREHLDTAVSSVLGRVHGDVRVLQERAGVLPVVGIHRDADGGADAQVEPADVERGRQDRLQILSRTHRVVGPGDVGKEHRDSSPPRRVTVASDGSTVMSR